MTKQEAIAIAEAITRRYPEAKTANEAIDLSRNDGWFSNQTEVLAVWGRLLRLLPPKVGE